MFQMEVVPIQQKTVDRQTGIASWWDNTCKVWGVSEWANTPLPTCIQPTQEPNAGNFHKKWWLLHQFLEVKTYYCPCRKGTRFHQQCLINVQIGYYNLRISWSYECYQFYEVEYHQLIPNLLSHSVVVTDNTAYQWVERNKNSITVKTKMQK